MLPYDKQLQYKQQEAEQNLIRIGKVTDAVFLPIAGAADTVYYRNKLEFTFSNNRYVLPGEIAALPLSGPPLFVLSLTTARLCRIHLLYSFFACSACPALSDLSTSWI